MILVAMTFLPAACNTAGIKTNFAAETRLCLAGYGGVTAEKGRSERGL
jgi:hypothetical protein